MKQSKTAHATTAFIAYAGLLVYLSLAVLSISDRQFIISKTVLLPILNWEIPLNGFFIAAPVMAMLLYLGLQIYVHKVLAFHEYWKSGLSGKLFKSLSALVLWGVLPLFLILVAFTYVKTHEPVMSYVIGATPIFGALVILGFWRKHKPFGLAKSFMRKMVRIIPFLLVIGVEIVLLAFLIPWAQEGLFPKHFGGGLDPVFRPIFCVNLSHQRLVTGPADNQKDLLRGNFEGIHLEGARLRYGLLKRANLRNAFMRNSDAAFAVLEEADLSHADLFQVNFWNANLRRVNFFKADLFGAFFREADVRGANLKETNLRFSRLFLANFQEADLSSIDARGADFWTVDFGGANLSRANLQGLFLNKSNLAEANLKKANLQETRLWKTNLRMANLEGADLRGVKGLELEQLADVKTLYKASLDQELLNQIRERYPYLLEKPGKKD